MEECSTGTGFAVRGSFGNGIELFKSGRYLAQSISKLVCGVLFSPYRKHILGHWARLKLQDRSELGVLIPVGPPCRARLDLVYFLSLKG